MFLLNKLIPEFYCRNIVSSLDFYVKILGFQILYSREEEKFAMLERQGSQIMLEQLNPLSERCFITAELFPPFGRGMNLQIQTNQVEDLYNCVIASQASVFLPLEEKWYRIDHEEAGNKQFIVLDPDGYLLRFFEDLGARQIT